MPKNATTTSPSVTHVADAQPFMTWLFSGVPFQAVCCQTILPLLRSTQNTSRSAPFGQSAEVRKMRSPQMIGDDWPMPGSCVFQTTLLADHFTGNFVSVVCPFCSGPRHRGQFVSPWAAATKQPSKTDIAATIRGCIFVTLNLKSPMEPTYPSVRLLC